MIILFGASSSLGQSIAKSFIDKGISVLGISRKDKHITLFNKTDLYDHIPCDLSITKSQIQSIFEDLSKNQPRAIIFAHRYRSAGTSYSLSEHLHVECLMPLFISEYLSTCTSLRSIIFVTSIASRYVCSEQGYGYHFSKACIDSMVRKMAIELAEKGISVNAISLGYVKQAPKENRSDNYYEMDEMVVPRGRAPSVYEISKVIQSLYSLPPAVVTGQIINADAGVSLLSHASLAYRLINNH